MKRNPFRIRRPLLLLAALAFAPLVAQDASPGVGNPSGPDAGERIDRGAWVDFEVPWRVAAEDPVLLDLSFLLRKPVGADGFVRIQDGRLAHGDGSRFRIWGVNVAVGACFPGKGEAPAMADFLARFGINCVRFHFLDSNWGPEKSLFEWGTESTRRLDGGQLDRLDYFVAELKKRGIYSNFNLNAARHYRKDDDVVDWEYLGMAKAVTLFDARLIELQQEYARQLLTHVNPYTERAYFEEPALAIIELANENSLVEAWYTGRLVGREPAAPADATWAGITRHYAGQLDRQYQAWLRQRLSVGELRQIERTAGVATEAPIDRLRSEEFEQADASRFATEARFYMELEDRFFSGMQSYLKETLGVHALVVATSDHHHSGSGYPLLASASKLDVVDGHAYWQNPQYTRDPVTGGRGREFTIPNTPMVNAPLYSTPVRLSRSAIKGKPYIVSETGHPFPNEYACEGIGILAAYALFQDWDGIFFFNLERDAPRAWDSNTPRHHDMRPDPVKMVNLAVCGLMFHRGDVAAARQTVLRSYAAEQVIESLRLPSRESRPFFTPGFSPAIPLVHAIRIDSLSAEPTRHEPLPVAELITSDTGQLRWRLGAGQGFVTVETGRTEAMIGFLPARAALEHLSASVEYGFCSLVLSSVDGQEIARADRLVLAATARTQLSDMDWNETRTSLTQWGRRPMQIEPVRGRIELHSLHEAKALSIRALDGAGRALGPAAWARPTVTGWEIALDQPTVWYRIDIER